MFVARQVFYMIIICAHRELPDRMDIFADVAHVR